MKNVIWLSLAASLIHLALILLVAVASLSSRDGPMLWLVFRGIDYPIAEMIMDSMLWELIPKDFSLIGEGTNGFNYGANFWRPLILFGSIGTIWWALIGALIGSAINGLSFIEKRRINKTKSI